MKNKILAYLAILTAIMLISVPIALALDSTDAAATSRGTPAPEVIAPIQEPIADYKAMLERGAIRFCDSEGQTWDLDIDGFWLYGERCSPCRDVIGVVLWPVIVLFDDAATAGAYTSNMWVCVWNGEVFDCYWRNTAGSTGTGSMWFCEPEETEYYAVIAGIADYMYINDLSYTDDDAKDIYKRLLSYPNTPWKEDHIKLLIDGDAKKADIKAGIDWMKANADEDDVCMFFFSGHGTYGTDVSPIDESDGYDEYICPADHYYLSNGIRDDELDAWMTPIKAKKIVMIDSCFSGGAIKEADASIKTMSGVPRAELTDSFAKDLNKAGYVVLTASDDDEVSWELGVLQNGVFAYCVDKGLGGPANSDGDKDISAEEIYDYIRPKVISATGDKQHPQIYDGVTGELPVVKW